MTKGSRKAGEAPAKRSQMAEARRALLMVLGPLTLVLGLAWSCDQKTDEGELRTLGSWTNGHGSPFADVQTGLFGDAYLTHNLWVQAVAFSPDGARLASYAQDGLIIWQVEDGAEVAFHDQESWGPDIRMLRYTPSGDAIIAVNSYGDITHYNPDTAAPIRSNPVTTVVQEQLGVGFLRPFALWVGGREQIRVGAYVEREREHRRGLYRKFIVVVDAVAGQVIDQREVDWENIEDAAFSGDGRRVAASGYTRDKSGSRYSVLAWDVGTPHAMIDTTTQDAQYQVALDATGELLMTLGHNKLSRWRLPAGERLPPLGVEGGGYEGDMVLGPGGRVARSSYEDVMIYEPNGDRVAQFHNSRGRPISIALSPDGAVLATGGDDQRVKLWAVP